MTRPPIRDWDVDCESCERPLGRWEVAYPWKREDEIIYVCEECDRKVRGIPKPVTA